MKKLIAFMFIAVCTTACEDYRDTVDGKQQRAQEKILSEGNSAVGMPAIKNFRERRMLKMLLELRDQEDLSTKTYIYSEMTGKTMFLCDSIGYGLPYATQYTSPEKPFTASMDNHQGFALPQADPNGLFSPPSAEGTWVMCRNPGKNVIAPVYVEPRIIVAPFEIEPRPNTDGKPAEEVPVTIVGDKTKQKAPKL